MARIDFSGSGGRGEQEMRKEPKEIKVKVTLTQGYEKRFTEACLAIIKKREAGKEEVSA